MWFIFIKNLKTIVNFCKQFLSVEDIKKFKNKTQKKTHTDRQQQKDHLNS